MIISDKHKFAFIHIPKCAGTSVRRIVEKYDDLGEAFSERVEVHPVVGLLDYTHIPLHILAAHFPEQYQKVCDYAGFAIVRNPAERFPSAVAQRAKMYRGAEVAALDASDIKAEVDAVMEHFSKNGPSFAPEYIHFAPQISYVENAGERVVANIYPMDRLDLLGADLSALVGEEVGPFSQTNRTVVYKLPALKSVLQGAGKAADKLLPAGLVSNIRSKARSVMMQPAKGEFDDVFSSNTVKDFIENFYKADIELFHEARSRADAIAA